MVNVKRVLAILIILILAVGISAPSLTSMNAAADDGDEYESYSYNVAEQVAEISQRKQALTPAQRKIDSNILEVVRKVEDRVSALSEGDAPALQDLSTGLCKINDAGNIQVKLTVTDLSDERLELLEDLGMQVSVTLPEYGIIEGALSYYQVEAVAGLDFVTNVRRPGYIMNNAGDVTSAGDTVLRADEARAAFDVDGSGVKIGVMSDGVTHLSNSVASGDLPSSPAVDVLKAGSGDEGTAMLEIIHDLAPGAPLAFYSPDINTSSDMVAGIAALEAAGCNVIVDNLWCEDEPKFEDGPIAQEARQFVSDGGVYITSAGNSAQRHYMATYVRTGAPLGGYDSYHDYDGGDIGNTFPVPDGGAIKVILQWNNQWGLSGDDFDLWLSRSSDSSILSRGENVQDGTGDPWEELIWVNDTGSSVTVSITILEWQLVSAPSSLILNYIVVSYFSPTPTLQYSMSENSVFGHSAIEEVLSVAAADAATPNTIEDFSSRGPGTVYFPAYEERQVPNITGVDGVQTKTGQLGYFSNPFFGTSASAPHLASIAALVWDADPTLTSSEVRNALTSTSVDLGSAGYDYTWGFGRVDAYDAVASVIPPSEVWVDDDWAGLSRGDPADGHTFDTDAFATIQEGIDAVAGSTVHVAAGAYYENITLKDGVEVLGAGADVTTIDGGGSGSVVTPNNVGSGTILDGFTITNGSAEYGAGMYNNNSSPTVTNCTFSGNSATYHGGGIYNWNSSPAVTNCTFSGNSATYNGGGMYNYNSSPTVTNCTFSGNSATYYGGGMYNHSSSSPTVTNCTFSGNSAAYNGGGMYNINSSPTVTNCILWDGGDEIYNSSSTPVVTYCDIQGGYTGTGNIDADPLFVNPAADDYHLQPTSPCINAGDNSAIPGWLTTDFEGDPRIADGVVDMGADEYLPSGPNTPPGVSNVTASQGSPIVDITYDVSDAEQSDVTIIFEYWDGDSWEPCITTTGEGPQATGVGKSGTWNAKTDFDEHYMTDCKIRVTADDGQAGNNTGTNESGPFILDTKDPTDYSCNTPDDGATDVSVNPDLVCLTASDDSPPLSYYFQIAENDTFSQGLQESGWLSDTTWPPSTLDYNMQYFWRIKAKDNEGNESEFSPTFSFTASASVAGTVNLSLLPESQSIKVGDTINVAIQIDCGTQEVSASDIFLNFDANKLMVLDYDTNNPGVQIAPGTTLSSVSNNHVDNTMGFIDYSAAKLDAPFPSGIITIATIRFQALASATPDTLIIFNTSGIRTTAVFDPLSSDVTGILSNGTYMISELFTGSYDVPLVAGWNMISLPLIPDIQNTAILLSPLGMAWDAVWYYDTGSATWTSRTRYPAAGRLTTMSDGKGYYLLMNSAGTLTFTGKEFLDPPNVPPSYTVVDGWNMVGFKSVTPKKAGEYLSAIDGKYTIIYRMVNGIFSAVNPSDYLNPGEGFWIAIINGGGTIYP
ncbi:S8 family serine peptidase [Chloroflexota bacterium]